MMVSRILIVVVTAAAISATVFAQVSPRSPAPDSATLVTVEGRVTRVTVTRSEVNLYIDVAGPNSDTFSAWVIETGSLDELSTKGIKLSDLRVGRIIRAKGTPGSGRNTLEVPVSGISFPQ